MAVGSRWPESGRLLLSELGRYPGRICLIAGDNEASVATAIATLVGTPVVQAGRFLLSSTPPKSSEAVVDRLVGSGPVIIDLDLLFWQPWLHLNPLAVLRLVSRRRPGTVAAWPGTITADRIAYSSPGRRDWYEATFDDAIVLRPETAAFPDDTPFRIERIP
jgi:hypothetical protein